MKNFFCLFVGLLFAVSLCAQSTGDKKTILSVHAGPSWYLGRFMGVTDRADAYCDDLRKGVSWDINWLEQFGERKLKLGLGLVYQGSLYKNTHETGADKIQMHYLAPQIALSMVRKHYLLQLSGGLGYQFYRDKSTVYDKPRKVSMSKFAGNLALSGEYFLTNNWGASARLNWLSSSSNTYSVEYNDDEWHIEMPKTGSGYFGQLSLTFGLNYHF